MRTRVATMSSWIAVSCAVGALAAVVLFAFYTRVQHAARSEALERAQAETVTEESSMVFQALARDTKDLRKQLDDMTRVDVLDAAGLIESVGDAAGVAIKINAASLEPVDGEESEDAELRAVSFLVEAEGSFAALMRTAELFETLPLPSSVQNLELERALSLNESAGKTVALWRLTARISVFTSSEIPS
ncbi:MAG: hypothetical protein UY63_C0017G0063 [Parcubacteria group bacterium GW2011_GWA2_51_10]|nr:MAG: hypothetical protein UY63_C0017G0063 [Parcubacteria group bacterium GW2011_GWA2_51_10]